MNQQNDSTTTHSNSLKANFMKVVYIFAGPINLRCHNALSPVHTMNFRYDCRCNFLIMYSYYPIRSGRSGAEAWVMSQLGYPIVWPNASLMCCNISQEIKALYIAAMS